MCLSSNLFTVTQSASNEGQCRFVQRESKRPECSLSKRPTYVTVSFYTNLLCMIIEFNKNKTYLDTKLQTLLFIVLNIFVFFSFHSIVSITLLFSAHSFKTPHSVTENVNYL